MDSLSTEESGKSVLLPQKSKREDALTKSALGLIPKKPKWMCEQIFDETDIETLPGPYKEIEPEFKRKLEETIKQPLEGNIGEVWKQTLAYSRLANNSFVKTICETGFNAGHSALGVFKPPF